MAYSPRKLKPIHVQVVRLHLLGYNNLEIATIAQLNPQYVGQLIVAPEVQDIVEELQKGLYDTWNEVQQTAQVVAPLVIEEKVRLALHAKDERVRSTSCMDVLSIAGHQPVKRVQIEVTEEVDPYKDQNEEEIRQVLMKELGLEAKEGDNATIH